MRRLTDFRVQLALIALVALAIRTAYALVYAHYIVLGDAMTFHQVAQHLADGQGFHQPFTARPTAEHPPLYELWLAGLDKIGIVGYLGHRLADGALGTVTVVLVGLLGRRVAGPAVGAAGAALAAVYPILWTADGALMSETLYGTLLVAALLAAVALRDRPTVRRAALLGALLALAALTRGEAAGLLVLLVVPLVLHVARGWRPRLRLIGVTVLAFAVVLAPWTARNLATFRDPVPISSDASGLWVGANCRDTYYGPLIGSWRFQCYTPGRPGEDESQYFDRQRSVGMSYAGHHLGRLPLVVAMRIGRLFDVVDVGQSLFLNAVEGRPASPMHWAIRSSWAMMLLALAGTVLLARRRRVGELIVLLAPVALVVLVAALTYGSTRFRFAAEPSFCLLAATALVALAQTVPGLRRRLSGERTLAGRAVGQPEHAAG